MNKARTLRRQLGAGYTYTRLLAAKEVRRLQAQPPPHFVQRTVAVLVAGCLKLETVLFGTATGPVLGYDLFVKDDPHASDWIYYGSRDAAADGAGETQMAQVLDALAQREGLSYTVCCFERLDGAQVRTDDTGKVRCGTKPRTE